jgi:phosphoribosylglycinamide formyltransferase 1
MNESSPPGALPIAVLISGSGTTLRNLIEKIEAGTLPVEIRLVISSSAAARGLEFARQASIPMLVVERRKSATEEEFSRAVFDPCRQVGAMYVVMGGFLKHVLIPPDFENRVVNIHPALLPAFGGKGMYGLKVHQAVLDAGVKSTGCTVHFVDNQYDHGPIILQRSVPVQDNDTAEILQARVSEAEREAYPEAIRLLAADRVSVHAKTVTIK